FPPLERPAPDRLPGPGRRESRQDPQYVDALRVLNPTKQPPSKNGWGFAVSVGFFSCLAGGRVVKMHPVPRLVALPDGQTLPVHRKSLLVPFLPIPGRRPRGKDAPRPPAGCPARGADASGPQKKVFWFLFFRKGTEKELTPRTFWWTGTGRRCRAGG